MSDPADPTQTVEDLLAAAEAEGLVATHRTVRNWVEEGLLDRPWLRGRGPRRGVEGLWSDHQRQLFITLLRQAETQQPRRNAPLANVPVWIWLEYGDDYVPLRQVRRALKTWAVPARHPAASSADATARSLVDRLAHPNASRAARRRFRDVVARGQAGEQVAYAEMVVAARPAIDPSETGPRGRHGVRLSPEIYASYIDFVLAGADAVVEDRGGERLPDSVLRQARTLYRESRASYTAHRVEYAADPDLGHLHADGSVEAVIQSACRDLILCVGVILVGSDWRRRRKRRRGP
jgi:hypothetical protein